MKTTIITIIFIISIGLLVFCNSQGTSNATNNKENKETVLKEKQLWTCSMHPEIVQDHPGNCPKCDMKLIPVEKLKDSSANSSEHNMEEHHHAHMIEAGDDDTLSGVKCTVMSEHEASRKHKIVYEGKEYYFCCEDCAKEFNANPGKFTNL